jgi:DNA replication licensing factor MCM5
LAAANPIFGRYDDMRSPEEQIDFQTTILSRFDMIFIVRDIKDSKNDEKLARHVMNVHKTGLSTNKEGDMGLDELKRYIAYCRMKVSPRISIEASETLKNYYVKQRYLHKNGTKSIPITVRQLEALIRISESLAKMRLSSEATQTDALEAIRLFTSSTVQAIQSNVHHIPSSDKASQDIQKVEEEIKKRLPIQSTTNQDSLLTLLEKQGFDRNLSEKAIYIMCQRKELEYRYQRKCVFRKR